MTVQHTDPATAEDRIAAIRARLNAAEQVITGKRRQDDAVQVLWFHAVDDIEFLLSELEAAQARLDKWAELHTMERRYTDESRERSYDTRQEAADALGITPGAAVYLDVCSHCGSIEMDAGAEDYRESLWPCADARALGLGEEGDDGR